MALGIGNAIGIPFQRGSAVPWTPDLPLSGETPNFWVKEDSRSGLTLTDSVAAANASILPAYLYKPTGDEYFKISDNGALDIGATDFTFAMWIKGETISNPATIFYYGGKAVYGNAPGRYAFQCAADSKYACMIQSSGGAQVITSTVLATDLAWHFLLLDVNQSTSKFRFFIDNVQIGADVAYTGTFPAMVNAFEFCIGSGNDSTGTTYYGISKSSHSDTYIFNKLLTPTEKTTLFNRGSVTGVKAHWPLLGSDGTYEYDASSNGYHLTGIGITKDKYKYGSYGSRHGLNIGYTLYEGRMAQIYVPYTDVGAEITTPPMPVGATKTANFNGDLLNHNLSNSMIGFAGASWDRSDVTIYNAFAIRSDTYYDGTSATTKKYWHITELNNILHQSWCNVNYKGLNFCKITDHSYKTRRLLTDLFSYTTNKTGTDYSKIMTYVNDYVFTDIYENDYIYWKYDSQIIIATRNDKVLKYDNSVTIYLSIDKGITFPYSKSVTGWTGKCQFAHIFSNGNILVADYNAIYLSTDNLNTVNEITPLDIAGAPYVSTGVDSYFQMNPMPYPPDDKPFAWGNYSINPLTKLIDINVWYTIDNGATIKSCYKAGVTGTPIATFAAGHIHAVTYNSITDSYWLDTGDGQDTCNWIEGVYTSGTDSWVWTKLYGDNVAPLGVDSNGTYYKTSGFGFYGGYTFWASDSNITARDGIYKCLSTGLANTGNYTMLFKTPFQVVDLLFNSTGEIICFPESIPNGLITSNDYGVTFKGQILYSLPVNIQLHIVKPKNTDGWYYTHYGINLGNIPDWPSSGVIWIKIK